MQYIRVLLNHMNENGLLQDVAYQGVFHDSVKDYVIKALRSVGTKVAPEVTLILPGVPSYEARLDILARGPSGQLYGIEIKTGDDPTFTPGQQVVYPHSIAGVGVFSPDSKVTDLGLLPYVALPPFPITVIYAFGPGSPFQYYELPAEPH